MRADATMTRHVLTVPPALSLRVADALMRRENVRHLPVLQGDRLVGIVSDRDILLRTDIDDDGRAVADVFVADAMSLCPLTATPDTSVSSLAATMVEHKIDAIPILGPSDRLVGLVTSTDLLTLLIDDNREKKTLPFRFLLRMVDQTGQVAAA